MVGNLLPADFDHDRVVRVCQRLPYFGTDIVEDHVLSGITDEQGMFSAVVQNNRPLFFSFRLRQKDQELSVFVGFDDVKSGDQCLSHIR